MFSSVSLKPWQSSKQEYIPVHVENITEEAEKGQDTDEQNRNGRTELKNPSRGLKLLIVILLSFIIAENAYFLYPIASSKESAYPRFEMEDIVIVKNETWEVGASDATNALWETVVPGISGWVQVPFPRRKNLPEGLPSFDPERPDDEVYIVTWGHQHHCLKMLRKAFWELIYGTSSLVGADMYGNNLGFDETQAMKHLTHCWDYLRQTVSCQSDLTLEGIDSTIKKEPFVFDLNGYSITHKCKERAGVTKWLLNHAPTQSDFFHN